LYDGGRFLAAEADYAGGVIGFDDSFGDGDAVAGYAHDDVLLPAAVSPSQIICPSPV
jgi:hypothetical protein